MIGVWVVERHTLLSNVVIENADQIWLWFLMDRVQKHLLTPGHRNKSEKQALQRPV
jgi:hypothetical protein